jgi:hypothetical protein
MRTMRARRYGRIVNLASIAAIGTALSGNAFYAATKAEVVILTRRRGSAVGRVLLEGSIAHLPDVLAESRSFARPRWRASLARKGSG